MSASSRLADETRGQGCPRCENRRDARRNDEMHAKCNSSLLQLPLCRAVILWPNIIAPCAEFPERDSVSRSGASSMINLGFSHQGNMFTGLEVEPTEGGLFCVDIGKDLDDGSIGPRVKSAIFAHARFERLEAEGAARVGLRLRRLVQAVNERARKR